MKETELTEELIKALENSTAGFDLFKKSFDDCASAFEVGDDQIGLKIIENLTKPLQDFLNFCADMIGTHANVIEEDLFKEICDQCESFENLINELLQEMEDKNYVEVGDILKYDLGDLTKQMAKTFPKIANDLKKALLSTKS
jgi:hypothetical protein